MTYYRPDAGVRIELSAQTFTNWVDKTANLITTELDLSEGDTAAHLLAEHHPIHWVSLVWTAALWQVGVCVAPAPADLAIVGPEAEREDFASPLSDADQVVACSLHPLGLGFSTDLPAEVVDYGTAVRSQPDVFLGVAATPGADLWEDSSGTFTWAQLSDLARTRLGADGSYGRRMVRPADARSGLLEGLVAPLLGDGSAVLIDGEVDQAMLDKIRADEQVAPV